MKPENPPMETDRRFEKFDPARHGTDGESKAFPGFAEVPRLVLVGDRMEVNPAWVNAPYGLGFRVIGRSYLRHDSGEKRNDLPRTRNGMNRERDGRMRIS